MTPDELQETLALLNRAVEYADAAALSFADRALDARNGHTAETPSEMDAACAQASEDAIDLRDLASNLPEMLEAAWLAGRDATVAKVAEEATRLQTVADDIRFGGGPYEQAARAIAAKDIRSAALRIGNLATALAELRSTRWQSVT